METPGMNNKELSSAIGLSASTVSWHVKKLVDAEIVEKTVNGRESNFEVSGAENVAELMITYKECFFDKMLDNFIEMWEPENKNK